MFSQISDRINAFNQMFTDLHKNDQVLLDYVPGKGTSVSIKGELKGLIPGEDFNRALLSVWLGAEPVTESLKNSLLGRDEAE